MQAKVREVVLLLPSELTMSSGPRDVPPLLPAAQSMASVDLW